MLSFVTLGTHLEHSAGQQNRQLQGQANDNLEIYLSAHSNSVDRKEYRVGDPFTLRRTT